MTLASSQRKSKSLEQKFLFNVNRLELKAYGTSSLPPIPLSNKKIPSKDHVNQILSSAKLLPCPDIGSPILVKSLLNTSNYSIQSLPRNTKTQQRRFKTPTQSLYNGINQVFQPLLAPTVPGFETTSITLLTNREEPFLKASIRRQEKNQELQTNRRGRSSVRFDEPDKKTDRKLQRKMITTQSDIQRWDPENPHTISVQRVAADYPDIDLIPGRGAISRNKTSDKLQKLKKLPKKNGQEED